MQLSIMGLSVPLTWPYRTQKLKVVTPNFLLAQSAHYFVCAMLIFYAPHETQTERKTKKVIQDFGFSDLRAGETKRAGDVTVKNVDKNS